MIMADGDKRSDIKMRFISNFSPRIERRKEEGEAEAEEDEGMEEKEELRTKSVGGLRCS